MVNNLFEKFLKKGRISKLNELEVERHVNFFDNSYKDNLEHSKENTENFPRWSIISGYYSMHDITKLLFAKKFRIKVELKVHETTIKLLKILIQDKELISFIEIGYHEFKNLANDLVEAKKERVKVQYYTGTEFMKEKYKEKATDFLQNIVMPYLEKILGLIK